MERVKLKYATFKIRMVGGELDRSDGQVQNEGLYKDPLLG